MGAASIPFNISMGQGLNIGDLDIRISEDKATAVTVAAASSLSAPSPDSQVLDRFDCLA